MTISSGEQVTFFSAGGHILREPGGNQTHPGVPRKKEVFRSAERAFQISLPQIETEAFSVNSGGGEVVAYRRQLRFSVFRENRLLYGDICHIIPALGFGNDISVLPQAADRRFRW